MKEDSYKHQGLRRQLLYEIEHMGIHHPKVLQAIWNVPRHFFMDSAFLEHAYQNKAFAIGEGQTISQPYTVAYQTALLEVEEKQNILEIGTGSGYQTAILASLSPTSMITSVEFHSTLHQKAMLILHDLGYKAIELVCGDGSKGYEKNALYDRILVTAAAPKIPKAWITQLAVRGKLVVPVGNRKVQTMMRYTKISEHEMAVEAFDSFRFVPLLGKNGFE